MTDLNIQEEDSPPQEEEEQPFRLSDLTKLTSSYWLWVCGLVCYYSCSFPFVAVAAYVSLLLKEVTHQKNLCHSPSFHHNAGIGYTKHGDSLLRLPAGPHLYIPLRLSFSHQPLDYCLIMWEVLGLQVLSLNYILLTLPFSPQKHSSFVVHHRRRRAIVDSVAIRSSRGGRNQPASLRRYAVDGGAVLLCRSTARRDPSLGGCQVRGDGIRNRIQLVLPPLSLRS